MLAPEKYAQLIRQQHELDREVVGYTLRESASIFLHKKFNEGEFMEEILEPLTEKVVKILQNQLTVAE